VLDYRTPCWIIKHWLDDLTLCRIEH
jgi:hypothetical protein